METSKIRAEICLCDESNHYYLSVPVVSFACCCPLAFPMGHFAMYIQKSYPVSLVQAPTGPNRLVHFGHIPYPDNVPVKCVPFGSLLKNVPRPSSKYPVIIKLHDLDLFRQAPQQSKAQIVPETSSSELSNNHDRPVKSEMNPRNSDLEVIHHSRSLTMNKIFPNNAMTISATKLEVSKLPRILPNALGFTLQSVRTSYPNQEYRPLIADPNNISTPTLKTAPDSTTSDQKPVGNLKVPSSKLNKNPERLTWSQTSNNTIKYYNQLPPQFPSYGLPQSISGFRPNPIDCCYVPCISPGCQFHIAGSNATWNSTVKVKTESDSVLKGAEKKTKLKNGKISMPPVRPGHLKQRKLAMKKTDNSTKNTQQSGMGKRQLQHPKGTAENMGEFSSPVIDATSAVNNGRERSGMRALKRKLGVVEDKEMETEIIQSGSTKKNRISDANNNFPKEAGAVKETQQSGNDTSSQSSSSVSSDTCSVENFVEISQAMDDFLKSLVYRNDFECDASAGTDGVGESIKNGPSSAVLTDYFDESPQLVGIHQGNASADEEMILEPSQESVSPSPVMDEANVRQLVDYITNEIGPNDLDEVFRIYQQSQSGFAFQ